MNWDKINKARDLIKSGFYDDQEIYEDILNRHIIPRLSNLLKNCPIGKGNKYRDITAEILAHSLHNVVDCALMRKEFSCNGGRGDFEMPLSVENLSNYTLWSKWCDKFDMESIIVETKNMKRPAQPCDVAQVLGYIVTANLGRFGILVSRKGFTDAAMMQLVAIRKTDKFLILPFNQGDLEYLITVASKNKPAECMKFFRRKVTLLAQCA